MTDPAGAEPLIATGAADESDDEGPGAVRIRVDDRHGQLLAEVAVAWPDDQDLDEVLGRVHRALAAATGKEDPS